MTRRPTSAAVDAWYAERGRIVARLHAEAERLMSMGDRKNAEWLRQLATEIARGDI